MIIRLENLIPLPLLGQQRSKSEIWESSTVIFEPGMSYLVEAPSGRGKTSLLSIIYGLRKDYQGKVFLDDTDINGIPEIEWSRLRKNNLSFIFQGLELFDELTALDNILLKNSVTREKTEEEIREMARRLDIGDFLHRKTGILSFGQQQRVAIIRALCQPFNFLLADECFSHMDRENSTVAYKLILEECKARNAGMILSSLNSNGEITTEKRLLL
ncbi:MAG: ATP-binding cassette domain-containing protein [Bacteroidetes bacterium]|nr:ATP-binding cassette domain-containing protein [Bacteroidota bacterium]